MPVVSLVGHPFATTDTNDITFGGYQSSQRGLNISFLLLSDYTGPQPIYDTGSSPTGWDFIGKMTWKTGLNTVWCFVLSTPETNVLKTLTATLGGVGGTGYGFDVERVVGMRRFGGAAVRQFVAVDNQTAGSTPEVVFPKACLSDNPTFFYVADSVAGPFLTGPVGWTIFTNTGYLTPTTGAELWARNSGFTGTTITGLEAPVTDFGVIGVELDASAFTASDVPPLIAGWGGTR